MKTISSFRRVWRFRNMQIGHNREKEEKQENKIGSACIVSPAIKQYEDLMLLTQKDVKNIMGMGETLLYDSLKDAPFWAGKTGVKLIILFHSSF